jgi:surface antigen
MSRARDRIIGRRAGGVRRLGAAALAGAVLLSGFPAAADPPPWAPAWGWRAKHARTWSYPYPAYSYDPSPDAAYGVPFGINLGRCNRTLIGGLLGGAAGAALGSQIGKGDGRTAAVIGGTVLGALLGGAIGRAWDRADYACLGQTLEYGDNRRPVVWRGPGGEAYRVTPREPYLGPGGRYCREFATTGQIGGRREQLYGTACRQPDGSWRIVS